MKQRRKQPQVTRRAILRAAGEQFALCGYAGSGLEAIVARTGLTKGALFHHFRDKRALAFAWLADEVAPAIRETWLEPLERVGELDELKSWCRERISTLEPDDPFSSLAAVAAETAAGDEELAAAFRSSFAEVRDAIAATIGRGKQGGWIHPSIDPDSEAALLLALLVGFSVTFRCGGAEFPRRQAVLAVEAYLDTVRKP